MKIKKYNYVLLFNLEGVATELLKHLFPEYLYLYYIYFNQILIKLFLLICLLYYMFAYYILVICMLGNRHH